MTCTPQPTTLYLRLSSSSGQYIHKFTKKLSSEGPPDIFQQTAKSLYTQWRRMYRQWHSDDGAKGFSALVPIIFYPMGDDPHNMSFYVNNRGKNGHFHTEIQCMPDGGHDLKKKDLPFFCGRLVTLHLYRPLTCKSGGFRYIDTTNTLFLSIFFFNSFFFVSTAAYVSFFCFASTCFHPTSLPGFNP